MKSPAPEDAVLFQLLPAAHTCANVLDLPKITDPDEMLRRLHISIEHVQGFTLI